MSRRAPRPIGYVVLTLKLKQNKKGDVWEGVCLELGTATFGDTVEETLAELRELITLDLNGLEQIGERERFFKKNQITLHRIGTRPQPVRTPVTSQKGELYTPIRQQIFPAAA
ncbi:hypothetical protein ES705_28110 [subsurface metagenome]